MHRGRAKPGLLVTKDGHVLRLKYVEKRQVWVRLDNNPEAFEAYFDETPGAREEFKAWQADRTPAA